MTDNNNNELNLNNTSEETVLPDENVSSEASEYDDIELPGQQSIFNQPLQQGIDEELNDESENVTYYDENPPQFYNETVRKQKKPKVWLVGLVSAIVGALIFSLASPFINSIIYSNSHDKFAFSVPEHKNNDESVNTLINNDDERKPFSASEIGKQLGPSIVGIVSSAEYSGFLSRGTQSGSGSGIIMSKAGHIITNYHVIQNASSVKVVLNTGKEYEATLIGSDEKSDIAVIKIDAPDLTPAVFGSSEELEPGDTVVAIGNPLGIELAGSLTQGIISAVNRSISIEDRTYKMIQTDAAINPGNSGGALVNAYGEVIGINSVKVSIAGVEGLGFAIPITDAMPIIEDLMNFGFVKGRPLIGLSLRYITQSEAYYYGLASEGIYVVEVTPGTGAEKAGIQKSDIIISCNDKEVTSVAELNKIRDEHKAGDTITLKINRNGNISDFKVILGEDTTAQQRIQQ